MASNQIEQIKKLYAKDKAYKIPKTLKEGQEQIEVIITSLTLEDLSLLQMGDDLPLSELAKNAKILFAKSLQIEEAEASKISIDFMEDLLSAVMDANNLDEKDMKKTGIKSFIEKKRAQIKAEESKNGTTPREIKK